MGTNIAMVSQDLATLAEEIILGKMVNHDLPIMEILRDKSLFPNRWSRTNISEERFCDVYDSNFHGQSTGKKRLEGKKIGWITFSILTSE